MKTSRLSERAMLVRLSTHEWTGKKKDKQVSEEACASKNADNDVIEAIINLAPPAELKAIRQARGKVYNKFQEMTLPWMRGGLNLLPSAMYMDYRKKMKVVLDYHKATVESLATRWPEIVANKQRLGKLASKYTLPTVDELRAKFYIEQDILPIPDVSDFRVDIGDDEMKEIQEQATKSFEESFNNATRKLWQQLANLLSNLAERMCTADTKFHDSIIENVKEFCDLIPKYNITNNPDLENIRKEVVDKITKLDPEDLREIPNHRKKAGADAKELLAKISTYMK